MTILRARHLSAEAIADAVAPIVQRGGLAIFPTDTVYGLGCDPFRPDSVARIFAIKGRPAHKPLALHLATVDEALEYAPSNALAWRAAAAFLPGPLTIVVPRPSAVGAWVTAGLETVGLRVPDHALATTLLERCGPLAGTSANRSGDPAYTGGADASGVPAADVRIDDGPTPLGVESTIIDVSGPQLRLVREGAISLAMLEHHLGPVARNDGTVR